MSNRAALSRPAPPPVVEVEGLEKSYGEVRALDGISFSVDAGSVVAFLGPNGAGKTTAIKILTGYLGADRGRARVCGHDVDRDPLAARSQVGYLPENNPLYPDMRVCDLLRFAFEAQRTGEASAADAIDRAVSRTGLAEVYRKFIGACSKGFRQRVGLAQALLHDPPLLILDEPTNGLDPLQVVEIRQLIRDLGAHKTVLVTTHVLPEVEALAERVVMIHRGRKVADGALAQLVQVGTEGLWVHVGVRGSETALRSVLQQAGATEVTGRSSPFADAAACAVQARVRDADALPALAAAVHAAGLEMVEFAPQGGSLEMLFQRLVTPAAAVSGVAPEPSPEDLGGRA